MLWKCDPFIERKLPVDKSCQLIRTLSPHKKEVVMVPDAASDDSDDNNYDNTARGDKAIE